MTNDFLDPAVIEHSDKSQDLKSEIIMRFGCHAGRDLRKWEKALEFTQRKNIKEGFWIQTAGRELLLRKDVLSKPLFSDFLKNNGPEDGLSFYDVLECGFSFSVFPAATAGSRPPVAVLMLLVSNENSPVNISGDHREFLEGSEIINGNTCVFNLLSEDVNITGRSWQLAYSVAENVLQDIKKNKLVNRGAVEKLAGRWILTGKTDGKLVSHAEMGNKIELAPMNMDRRWIVPATTGRVFEGAVCVDEVSDAVKTVTGNVIFTGEFSKWPAQRKTFYSFASRAMGPFIASLIITKDISEVVIWCSKDYMQSKVFALQQKAVIKELVKLGLIRLDAPEILIRECNAETIEDVYKELRDDIKNPEDILFNITQGNFLMKTAAVSLSELDGFSGLEYIYRDLSNINLDYIKLYRENRLLHSCVTSPGININDKNYNIISSLIRHSAGNETVSEIQDNPERISGFFRGIINK